MFEVINSSELLPRVVARFMTMQEKDKVWKGGGGRGKKSEGEREKRKASNITQEMIERNLSRGFLLGACCSTSKKVCQVP